MAICLVLAAVEVPAIGLNRQGKTRETGGDAWAFGKCDSPIYFRFVDSAQHNWGDAEKDRISDALSAWEDVVDRDGSQLVDLRRATGTPQIDIKVYDTVPGSGGDESVLATGRCDNKQIALNDRLLNNYTNAEIDGNLVHEMGHVMGLSHVSRDENSIFDYGDQSISTMASGPCAQSDFSVYKNPSKDDHAALNNRYGGGSAHTFQADPSFETAASINSYFSGINMDWSRVNSTSSPLGSYYLSFTGVEPVSGNDPYVYQSEVVGYPGTADASVQARKSAAGDSGTAEVRLLKRGIDRVTGSDLSCDLLVDGDWIVTDSKEFTPTTSFDQYTTTSSSISSTTLWMVRVSVVNRMVTCIGGGCQRAPLRIDDLKVREA